MEKITNPLELVADLYSQGHSHIAIGENHSAAGLHKLIARLANFLGKQANLKTICLEIDSSIQRDIDEYTTTGSKRALQRTIKYHEYLIRNGYPFQGRMNSDYFKILSVAKENNLQVKAIQMPIEKLKSEVSLDEINHYMAEQIPRQYPALIYAGEMHLRKDFAIPKFKPDVFSISAVANPLKNPEQAQSQVGVWLMQKMKELSIGKPFAFRLDSDLGKMLDKSRVEINYEPYSKWFDGLIVY